MTDGMGEAPPIPAYIYRYLVAEVGLCERCHRIGRTYIVGLEEGGRIARCGWCFRQMVEGMKRVRFIEVKKPRDVWGERIG